MRVRPRNICIAVAASVLLAPPTTSRAGDEWMNVCVPYDEDSQQYPGDGYLASCPVEFSGELCTIPHELADVHPWAADELDPRFDGIEIDCACGLWWDFDCADENHPPFPPEEWVSKEPDEPRQCEWWEYGSERFRLELAFFDGASFEVEFTAGSYVDIQACGGKGVEADDVLALAKGGYTSPSGELTPVLDELTVTQGIGGMATNRVSYEGQPGSAMVLYFPDCDFFNPTCGWWVTLLGPTVPNDTPQEDFLRQVTGVQAFEGYHGDEIVSWSVTPLPEPGTAASTIGAAAALFALARRWRLVG